MLTLENRYLEGETDKNNMLQQAYIEEGNLATYKEVFIEYYKPLCLEAFAMLKDEAAAEDIVQSVFTTMWKEQRLQAIHQSVKAYLKTAVRNACLNHIKRRKRETLYLQNQGKSNVVDETDFLELKEVSKKIESAVDKLPAQCRQIFTLVFYHRKKYEEAAQIAGVTVNTVKTQLRRAFAKLRESMYHFQE